MKLIGTRFGQQIFAVCMLVTAASQASAESAQPQKLRLVDFEVTPRVLKDGGTVSGRVVLAGTRKIEADTCDVFMSSAPVDSGPSRMWCSIQSINDTTVSMTFSRDFPAGMPNREFELYKVLLKDASGATQAASLLDQGFDTTLSTVRTQSVPPFEIASITITAPGTSPRIITQQGGQEPLLVKRGDAVALEIRGSSGVPLQTIDFSLATYRSLHTASKTWSASIPAPLYDASNPFKFSAWSNWIMRDTIGNYGADVIAESEGLDYDGNEFTWKGNIIIPVGSTFEELDLQIVGAVNRDFDLAEFKMFASDGRSLLLRVVD